MAECGIPDDHLANLAQAEEDLKVAFNEAGVEGIKKQVGEKLEEWKDVPIYVGVTGRSGVGKSSFINAIRGLEADDDGAAAIGVTETTTTVEQYPHPNNELLVLCDMPGIGTPTFSKSTYLTDRRIGFDKYDMFLIMTSDRFYEDDLWLAKSIKERNKNFLFIRTKVAQDVENQKKARPSYFRQNPNASKKLIKEIRTECHDNLKELIPLNTKKQQVFLIDNYEMRSSSFDADALTSTMITEFDALKRNTFILSLTAFTPSIMEAKKKVLRERIWRVCMLSALGGVIPIPGLSVLFDVSLVLKEATFYRNQLGLDEANLKRVAAFGEISFEKLTQGLKFMKEICFTHSGILQFCKRHAVSRLVGKTLVSAIPIIGSVVVPPLSYLTTKSVLEKVLDMLAEDAKRVIKCMISATGRSE